ncbi:hypothetical protein DFH11DRAFT_1502596 [Phellopilus nigrolimitatus]|nr:hypothetical protein DFH11DRAFT_1502596 [Phellopilus nigrolimitatus]
MAPAHAHAHGPPSSFPQNALLPGLEGLDATLAGEELARVLQDLDLPKLANALRALGDTGVSSVFPLPGQVGPEQSGSGSNSTIPPLPPDRSLGHGPSLTPTHVGTGDGSGGQVPAPSAVILGQPLHHPPAPPSVGQTASIAIPTWLEQDPDHAHLLANKWLSATKLNELARTKGLVYKKGKFSSTEENTIRESIESYREKNGLMHEQLRELIFAKGAKAKDTTFWFEITSQIPQRPVVAVYHHVRRSYHPMKQQGKWMPAEDDFLRQAVAELGQSWEKVSTRVGRMAGDCRDRWRNHINNREGRVMGVWSKEEEERLTQIVTEMTTAQGKDPDLDIFWTQVAARMGNRGRHQCRIKWTDALSKTVKNEGQKPRWSQQDAFILVHKIASLNVRDDSEIDWKLLADDDWNLWSAHSLQRRWLTLKRSVRGHEDMSHQEIMDILRVKKAHAPPTPGPVRVRVTSAPMVPVEAQAADVDVEMSSIAGRSGFVPVHSSGMGDPLPHFSSVAPADTQGDLRIGTSAIPTVVEVPLIDSSSSSSSSSSSDSDSDSSDSD